MAVTTTPGLCGWPFFANTGTRNRRTLLTGRSDGDVSQASGERLSRVGVTLRRLAEADLPLLHRWLNEPGVVRWWEGDDVSWDAVVRDYGTTRDSTEYWIASVGGRPVGWIQCYAVADSPEEAARWAALGVDGTAAGIDYLVGDPADRGRGLGTAIIRTFVAGVVFALHPGWSQACAAPAASNVASWRALQKAGFRFLGTVEGEDGPSRLMVADRPPVRLT